MVSLTPPQNVRGPMLDLALPASEDAIDIVVQNETNGLALALNIPGAWDGADLTLDWHRRTIRDHSGANRSALLDPSRNALWLANEPLVPGEANDLRVEAIPRPVSSWKVVEVRHLDRDSTYIYFSDAEPSVDVFGRVKFDGSGYSYPWVDPATTQMTGLRCNSSHIYWVTGTKIGRMKLDGTSVEKEWVTGLASEPNAIAVSDTYVFAIGVGSIHRVTIATKTVTNNIVDPEGTLGKGIAMDAERIYYLNANTDSIGRAKLDGTSSEPSWCSVGYDLASAVAGMDVAGGYVYFSDFAEGTISRVKTDGSGLQLGFVDGLLQVRDLVVATNMIYFASGETGKKAIGRVLLETAYAAKATLRWEKGYY